MPGPHGCRSSRSMSHGDQIANFETKFQGNRIPRTASLVSGSGGHPGGLPAKVGNWSTVSYWLDLGNNADSGQFILGEPFNERNHRSRLRLRTSGELFPEIVDPNLDNAGEPSCSVAAALERQEPFINSTLAQHALALLAWLFRCGELCYHGGFVNLATGVTSVLRIDPQYWKRTRRLSKHRQPFRSPSAWLAPKPAD